MSHDLHRLTTHPPLSWNSYDSFGCFSNKRRALENLAVFIERLKPHGYRYFGLDAGWYRQFTLGDREFPAQGEQVGPILMNGKGTHRMSGLNSPQKRTFMTLRALAASPLFMGGNLPGTDEESFALLTDPEMLACNQIRRGALC